MLPYWAKVRHEDVWTHFHPWYALEHAPTSWMTESLRIVKSVGKTVGEFFEDAIDDIGWMSVVGSGMVAVGVLILIPGPGWGFASLIGYALGGPVGATAAVVAYAVLGLLLIIVGSAMIYFD